VIKFEEKKTALKSAGIPWTSSLSYNHSATAILVVDLCIKSKFLSSTMQ